MGRLKRVLSPIYSQVLIAIVIATVLGLLAPDIARSMKPLGDAFIAALKVFIAPVVFCTVVLGLTQISDLGRLGRVVLKAFVYFEVASTAALAIGMLAGNLFQPGAGLHAGTTVQAGTERAVTRYQATAAQSGGVGEFLQGLIPDSFVGAFARGDVLQVLILSVLFGAAIITLKAGSERTVALIVELQAILFRIIGFIMRLAPLGAFGAMAYTVGTQGGGSLLPLLKLVALVYASCAVFVVVILGAVTWAVGLSLPKILRLVREELLVVLGTASAEAVLPQLLSKLVRAGCERSIVGLVLPTGYSFNTDGTAIYMSMAVIFIAQATDTPLTIAQQLGILGILLFTSKGGAGISGAGMVKLAATLQSVPAVPISGLGLLVGVDRFMSEARSLTNIIGNTVAVFVIAKWERGFDPAAFEACLAEQRSGRAPDLGAVSEIPVPQPQPGPIPPDHRPPAA